MDYRQEIDKATPLQTKAVMSDHVIKNGLDIPIQGRATGQVVDLDPPDSVAYSPSELYGFVPRLVAREGDEVRVGSVLFHAKTDPRVVVRSPVAGRVREIRRGARRVITDVVVDRTGDEVEPLPAFTLDGLAKLDRAAALEAALGTGMWATLRTRPLDRVPDPNSEPQAILIGAMETGPLQPDADVLLSADDKGPLQAAIHVLGRLTGGRVHLAVRGGANHPALEGLQGVDRHTFRGPHPAGDPAVQVNLIDPPRGGRQVWTLSAWDAALMGRALLTGRFPSQRVYAAVGAGVVAPRYVRTTLGAPLSHVVGEVKPGSQRWIRGSVLTGEAIEADRWAPFVARAVHVLPDEVPRSLFGWALPMLGTWSFHKAYLSGLLGSRPESGVDMRPGLFGGHRAMVPIGVYDKVVATPDILPEFLFKSISAGDLEESIQLGLLDISREEAALCTYICPAKIAFDELLRQGLALYEKEA